VSIGTGDGWRVYERLQKIALTALTPDARRLFALGDLRREVNNGGLHQYFFNASRDFVADAIEAAIQIGQTDLVALVERALAIVGAPYPFDRETRRAGMVEIEPAAFEDLDNEYYALEVATDLDAAMDLLASRI
jgi:hypothetical protein